MISSILELARYKVGDVAWWITMRGDELYSLSEDQEWMEEHHPKVLYDKYGPYRQSWPYHVRLPRLNHTDFEDIVSLLTSKLIVERFQVVEIMRSTNTAEFFYSNIDDDWMPESYLFDTIAAARKERTRILKLLGNWIKQQV